MTNRGPGFYMRQTKRKRICRCGKSFNAASPNQRHCSRDCAVTAAEERRKRKMRPTAPPEPQPKRADFGRLLGWCDELKEEAITHGELKAE